MQLGSKEVCLFVCLFLYLFVYLLVYFLENVTNNCWFNLQIGLQILPILTLVVKFLVIYFVFNNQLYGYEFLEIVTMTLIWLFTIGLTMVISYN